jgi:predicted TIM-barrel fold metal-dependent hydrolase
MGALVEVALRFPEVALVLAHAGIADQAVLATGLARHPRVLYDTSCFAPYDVVELFARVPAERIVFGSDAPYGQPVEGLFLAMRAAALRWARRRRSRTGRGRHDDGPARWQ